MGKIITDCAYCQKPISVSIWDYATHNYPVDVDCPLCCGRNNVNRASIFLAFATMLAMTLAPVGLARFVQGIRDDGTVLALVFVFVIVGWVLSAYTGSRLPRLVKYQRWWNRQDRP